MRIPTNVLAMAAFEALTATAAYLDTSQQDRRAVGEMNNIQVSRADQQSEFPQQKVCDNGQPYGCYQGHCWKTCGDIVKGEWCWTSKQPEKKSRLQCTTWLECGDQFREFGCVKGDRCTCGNV